MQAGAGLGRLGELDLFAPTAIVRTVLMTLCAGLRITAHPG